MPHQVMATPNDSQLTAPDLLHPRLNTMNSSSSILTNRSITLSTPSPAPHSSCCHPCGMLGRARPTSLQVHLQKFLLVSDFNYVNIQYWFRQSKIAKKLRLNHTVREKAKTYFRKKKQKELLPNAYQLKEAYCRVHAWDKYIPMHCSQRDGTHKNKFLGVFQIQMYRFCSVLFMHLKTFCQESLSSDQDYLSNK